MSTKEEENYSVVEKRLNENYENILSQMGLVSSMIKSNPENIGLKNILYGLAETANKIIATHIDFAFLYCDERYKENVIARLNEKQMYLRYQVAIELEEVENRGRTR